jgi:hypothetical protein
MKTKKAGKAEAVVVKQALAAAAAKPLGPSSPVAAPKAVVKKAVKEPQAAEQVKEVKIAKTTKEPKTTKKPKVVRDSFTMPQSEYQNITVIKESCLKAGLQVKKSEVLRAGLQALCAMDAEQLKKTLAGLDKIKTGRPNKH